MGQLQISPAAGALTPLERKRLDMVAHTLAGLHETQALQFFRDRPALLAACRQKYSLAANPGYFPASKDFTMWVVPCAVIRSPTGTGLNLLVPRLPSSRISSFGWTPATPEYWA